MHILSSIKVSLKTIGLLIQVFKGVYLLSFWTEFSATHTCRGHTKEWFHRDTQSAGKMTTYKQKEKRSTEREPRWDSCVPSHPLCPIVGLSQQTHSSSGNNKPASHDIAEDRWCYNGFKTLEQAECNHAKYSIYDVEFTCPRERRSCTA